MIKFYLCISLLLYIVVIHSYRSTTGRLTGFKCPNNCNNQGICERDHTCTCREGFVGADCSMRTCPYGISWSSKPYAFDLAHVELECAGNGICNRRTGKCKCFENFSGDVCERVSCGISNCNSHGTCLSMGYMYDIFKTNNLPSNIDNYTRWDSKAMTSCICDLGYIGANCDIKLCPKGYDPLIPRPGYRKIQLTTSSTWGLLNGNGKFLLKFNGKSLAFPADANSWNSTSCQMDLLNALTNIASATCELININNSGGGTYIITILSYPPIPEENNIYSIDGVSDFTKFSCFPIFIPDGASGLNCDLVDLSSSNSQQKYTTCSNRGSCDTSSGICTCFDAFTGPSCNQFKYDTRLFYNISSKEVIANSGNDVLLVESTSPNLNGSILHLASIGSGLKPFNYVQCSDRFGNLFTIDQDAGFNLHNGKFNVFGQNNSGGVTVSHGGVFITNGLTIFSGGLFTDNSDRLSVDNINLLGGGGIKVIGGVSLSSNSVLNMNEGLTIIDTGLYISRGLNINAGGMSVVKGGLAVTNGLTISNSGLYITRGQLTLLSGSLNMYGGMTISSQFGVTGGISVPEYGFSSSSLLNITGGMTTSTLSVLNSGLALNGGNLVTSELSVNNGMTLSGNLVIGNYGLSLSSGILATDNLAVEDVGSTISSSGLIVTAYGMTVAPSSQPLSINGGLTIQTGSIYMPLTGGLDINGGMTVNNAVHTGSMVVSGGCTIPLNGLQINNFNGLTILSGGLNVQNGLTIGQLNVNGGLSLNMPGINSADSLTVISGGVFVINKVNIASKGLIVTGGMTVNNGIGITAGGLSIVDSIGLYSYNGITIGNPGMNIQSSLTTASLNVKGFLTQFDASNGLVAITGGITATSNFVNIPGSVQMQSSGNPSSIAIANGIVVGGISTIANKITVTSNGIYITTGGLTVNNAFINNGLSIVSGGLQYTSSTNILVNGKLYVDKTLNIYGNSGSNIINTPMTIGSGFTATDKMVVSGYSTVSQQLSIGGNLYVTGGMSSEAGICFTRGGVSITGGIYVVGDVTISSPSIAPTANPTSLSPSSLPSAVPTVPGPTPTPSSLPSSSSPSALPSNSPSGYYFLVSGGITISAIGNLQSTNGITILNGGLYSNGGIQMGTNLDVTGGLSVSGSMTVSGGGVSVMSGGMYISNGLTVTQTGVYNQISTVTITNGGAAVQGNSIIAANGLNIVGPMSLSGGGLSMKSGGGYINSLYTTSLSIGNNGLSHHSFDSGMSVYGNVVVTGGLTVWGKSFFNLNYVTFSDERLKKNIESITNPLDKVSKIRGVYYTWKDRMQEDLKMFPVFDNVRHVGVIAQDVLKVFPEAVSMHDSSNKDSYLGVKYDNLIPLLIEAIRELDIKINDALRILKEKSNESPLQHLLDLTYQSDEISEKIMQLYRKQSV